MRSPEVVHDGDSMCNHIMELHTVRRQIFSCIVRCLTHELRMKINIVNLRQSFSYDIVQLAFQVSCVVPVYVKCGHCCTFKNTSVPPWRNNIKTQLLLLSSEDQRNVFIIPKNARNDGKIQTLPKIVFCIGVQANVQS